MLHLQNATISLLKKYIVKNKRIMEEVICNTYTEINKLSKLSV